VKFRLSSIWERIIQRLGPFLLQTITPYYATSRIWYWRCLAWLNPRGQDSTSGPPLQALLSRRFSSKNRPLDTRKTDSSRGGRPLARSQDIETGGRSPSDLGRGHGYSTAFPASSRRDGSRCIQAALEPPGRIRSPEPIAMPAL